MAALRLGVNVDHVATVRNARGGAAARSGARGAARHRSRRRRHHRASARGPPPHPRRRHAPPQGLDRQAAQFRDGGDRADARHRARASARTPAAWCRKSAPSARPRAASTSSAASVTLKPFVAELGRAGDPRFDVHRAVARSARSERRRSGRRSSNCTPAPGATRWRTAMRAPRRARIRPPARRRRPRPPTLGLECHAGHGLDYDTGARDRRPAADRRAQHRPFPRRRGDLRRPRGER